MAPIELVETSLRHGQQALLVSRLRERHAVAVAGQLDGCGFAALDVFGAATFEAQLRFLGEDPFARLRAIRKAAPSTPLLATIAGQSLVGHRHAADDVVDAFMKVISDCGVDIVRVSDPLNDIRNFERAIAAAKKSKRQVEGVIVHSDSWGTGSAVELAKALIDRGCDSLCVFDSLGVLSAHQARELVKALRTAVDVPIAMSISAQTGQADLACAAGVDSGATRLDVALAPLAGGTSFPAAEALIAAFSGDERDTGLNLEAVAGASLLLEGTLAHYADIADPLAMRLDTSALRGQLPISAMGHALTELRDRNALDRVGEVEQEIKRVRADLGSPPFVTPLTEIIAVQAVYNVCDGDRYLTISQEVKDYCLGLYGRPPRPIDPHVQGLVNGRDEPITCRPADLIEPGLPRVLKECERESIETSKENLVGMALFPTDWQALVRGETQVELLGDEGPDKDEVGTEQPQSETAPTENPPIPAAAASVHITRELEVEVDGQTYAVRVTGEAGSFGGGSGESVAVSAAPSVRTEGTVVAPMQGLILKVPVAIGDKVSIGDVVAVLEAMKMQNDIVATKSGSVSAIHVAEGALVAANDPVVTVG